MTMRFDCVVLGAGANGLTAAAAMARKGRRVLLVERSESLAGQAEPWEFAPGYRVAPLALDAGWVPPSVIRGLGLRLPERRLQSIPLTLALPDLVLPLAADQSTAAAAIRAHSTADAARWPGFAGRIHHLTGFLGEILRRPAPDIDTTSVADLMALLGLGRAYRRLGRQGMIEFLRVMPMSVQELLDDEFEAEPLKALLAPGGILDLRQGPRSGGTGYVLLHHLAGAQPGVFRGRGAWRDGPGALVSALEGIARSAGVTIRTGTPVRQIEVRDGTVAGVVSGDDLIEADTVVSTFDPGRTMLDLVDPVWLDPEFLHAVRQIRYRGSTAWVAFGLDTLPSLPGVMDTESLAGVVSLTGNTTALEQAYDATKYGELSERPHVELTVTSLRWPDQAPEGHHAALARVRYAPHELRDGRWDGRQKGALADRVTAMLEESFPGFGARVRHRAVLAPPDLEASYGCPEGDPGHGQLGLDQILFMRPVPGFGNYRTPIRGLYLGGAGSHPGPGIPGGPGWLAARQVLRGGNTVRRG